MSVKEDVHHSYINLSREAESFGNNFREAISVAGAVKDLLNRDPSEVGKIQLGALLRIAVATEQTAVEMTRIGVLLEVAVEPLLAEADKQRDERLEQTRAAWKVWLTRQEEIHGPCPGSVRERLWSQFHVGLRRCRPWTIFKNGWLLQNRSPAAEFGDFRPYPPCGPKTNTRREYNAWRKRRIRKKKGSRPHT